MDGAVHTYKARLVVKGFTQTYEVDYKETFSPVADNRAIRILVAITAFYDYKIWQLDVKTAFLNGHLFEEVYMVQPEGFLNLEYPNRVCNLKSSIYGFKQASRQWNKRFDDEIKKFGFTQNRDEPCVYKKASGRNVFCYEDLEEAAYILGILIYIDRSKRLIGLCQSAYIKKILKRFYMENYKRRSIPMQEKLKLCKSQGTSTPAEVKRMQYIPYASAWDLLYVKNILKYLRSTKDMFLVYGGDIKRDLRVSCYTDVGYLKDVDDLKSQTRYIFILNGGVVDSKSAGDLVVATPRAWVCAGVMTSTGMGTAYLVNTDTESDPEEAPSEIEKCQPLVSRATLTDEEFEMYRSSYETSSSLSPPALPIRKRYRGTLELIEDTEDESSDLGTAREGSKGEGHSLEEKGHGSEVRAADEPLRLSYRTLRHRELVVGEGEMPSMFEPTLVTWVDPEDGRVYIDIPTYVPPVAPVQTPLSPKWTFGSLLVLPSPSVVPLPIASPVTTPAATISVDEDYAIWRENHDLRMQIAKDRRERLELADRVARMERRQESRRE
ncbi:retrotransposon protein, putative, ty1-copia subclass [Tanacetum coccineum]